ncbi:MAG: hypothetical protein LBV17_12235 [Treponema sp.]|jgi:hypothetical protein|nr:hypothetical protein [Treponema sp.]
MNKTVGSPETSNVHVGRVKIKDIVGKVFIDCELAGDTKTFFSADKASVSIVIATKDFNSSLTNLISKKTPVLIEMERMAFDDFFIENIESSGVDLITIKATFSRKPTEKNVSAWFGIPNKDE